MNEATDLEAFARGYIQAGEQAEDLYRALRSSGRLTKLRRLTYRCNTSARCLLLDAVETPIGVVLHQRRYKHSDEVNLARSNEAGRARNTYDGKNHWMERTYPLEQSALLWHDERANLALQCDHVLDFKLTAAMFHGDWEARHAGMLVTSSGTRYAVG